MKRRSVKRRSVKRRSVKRRSVKRRSVKGGAYQGPHDPYEPGPEFIPGTVAYANEHYRLIDADPIRIASRARLMAENAALTPEMRAAKDRRYTSSRALNAAEAFRPDLVLAAKAENDNAAAHYTAVFHTAAPHTAAPRVPSAVTRPRIRSGHVTQKTRSTKKRNR